MVKVRRSRWEFRETLKELSNKRGDVKAMHPQVRRELDSGLFDDQVKYYKSRKNRHSICSKLKGEHDFKLDHSDTYHIGTSYHSKFDTYLCTACGKKKLEVEKLEKVEKV